MNYEAVQALPEEWLALLREILNVCLQRKDYCERVPWIYASLAASVRSKNPKSTVFDKLGNQAEIEGADSIINVCQIFLCYFYLFAAICV